MYRIPINNNESSSCKPKGLYDSMLRFEGKKSNFVHFLLICVIIYNIVALLLPYETSTTFKKYIILINCVTCTSQLIWLILLRSKRCEYIELVNLFERQSGLSLENPLVYRHFAKIRNSFLFYIVTINAIVAFFNFRSCIIIFQQSDDFVQSLKASLFNLMLLLPVLGFQLFNQFLVESSLYIHGCWLIVNEQIVSLRNIDWRMLTSDKVREIRSMYSIASETTERMDSFLRLPILNFYSYAIISGHIYLAEIIYNPSIVSFIILVFRFLIIALIAYNMIYIHYLSNKCFHDIYVLSYEKHPFQVNNEIQMFLDRIGQSNVGFSFLKISLITSTFVTSLASLTLSFALSVPTFFS
ncbi:uncharacterized protein LOC112538896 [Tetranychus urticae]|uniref:Gustatory receptor n=1 Tax=Tetranychus urticae TaxID=32264 RepID=T1KAK8_TETUR|nr:uncharacterized protein LOC112538896 [Tetranychus urticae]